MVQKQLGKQAQVLAVNLKNKRARVSNIYEEHDIGRIGPMDDCA